MICDCECASDYLDGLIRLLNFAETVLSPEEFKTNNAINFYDEEYKRVLGIDINATKMPVLFNITQERELMDIYEQVENRIDPMYIEYSREWRVGCCYIIMDLMKERGVRYPDVLGDKMQKTKDVQIAFLRENKNISDVSKHFLAYSTFLLNYLTYQCRIHKSDLINNNHIKTN